MRERERDYKQVMVLTSRGKSCSCRGPLPFPLYFLLQIEHNACRMCCNHNSESQYHIIVGAY